MNPLSNNESLNSARLAGGYEIDSKPSQRASIVYFLSAVVIQLSDFLFPLFLFAGLVWWFAPKLLGGLTNSVSTNDPQIHDLLAHLTEILGAPLHFKGFSLSAGEVVFAGFFFLFLSSACLTYLHRTQNDNQN